MGVELSPCAESAFEEVVGFVTRLNSQPEHHIGFFGASEGGIRQTLAALDPPVHESFVAAEVDGVMVGLMGVEYDIEIGRTWLFGPLVDHPNWLVLADALYDSVQALLPIGIREQDIFCDVRNQNCQAFAARHGFELRSEAAILNLDREHFAHVPVMHAAPFSEIYFDQLEALHDHLFPHTYYTARQMVGKQSATTHLLIVVDGGELQGYIFFKATPEAGEGYIDFVGVAEAYRMRGIGRRLLAAAVHTMAAHPEVQSINLTMVPSNTAAMRFYKGMGFIHERSMTSFRQHTG